MQIMLCMRRSVGQPTSHESDIKENMRLCAKFAAGDLPERVHAQDDHKECTQFVAGDQPGRGYAHTGKVNMRNQITHWT
eukprot:7430831-Pyramimonas_sp.AAC.1